ncbi:MAG TPA: hypothetical protein VFX66_06030 [Sulfuricurvum sp.]|nr:hypothetical protein [Sulfuricurvum sp.]
MSFKLKTILLFLGISLIPYALTMVFLGNSFREEQYEAVTKEMNTQLNLTTQRIDQHLVTLEKDMQFMAKSDVMNDFYTQDLDKRIGSMLSAKKYDMKMMGEFYLIDVNNIIVASSDFNAISKRYTGKSFFTVPVLSNLTQQQIGNLTVTYSLENFKPFFSNAKERQYYILHQDGSIYLRPSIFKESLQVSRSLSIKPDMTIVLEEEKEFA